MLPKLMRLDLSYTKQIDDSVVKSIALNLRNLKKLTLRFLNEISADSIVAVIEHQKFLEGLDISGCFKVNLDAILVKMRGNRSLKCLLLEYLFIQSYQLSHLRFTHLRTLSLFCKTINSLIDYI